METSVQQQHSLNIKNTCVQFMFAYQQKNLEKMLSFCDPGGTVEFIPLGEGGKGKIGELGKAVWGGLIECFPDIDNTLDAAVAENENKVRCQVVIRGTQEKDFADIKSKGLHFESDHIFIFRLNDENKIDHVKITWDHADFKKQLGAAMSHSDKISLLHQIAKDYVVKGLGEKRFETIPYHEDVTLRAPLTAGGSWQPIIGKENLRTQWWAPLPSLVGKTEFIDSFVNNDFTAVTVQFLCEILNPYCVLRIVDRFDVNNEGKITSQENFFDPRAVTNPA